MHHNSVLSVLCELVVFQQGTICADLLGFYSGNRGLVVLRTIFWLTKNPKCIKLHRPRTKLMRKSTITMADNELT